MLLASTAIVITATIALGGAVTWTRRVRRHEATRLGADESVLRLARGVTARLYVEEDVLGGPEAGVANLMPADLLLTPRRLVIGTHQGKMLEITPGTEASVRMTGPRRLVIEGSRPRMSGPLRVRAELLLDEPEAWVAAAHEHLGTTTSALPEG